MNGGEFREFKDFHCPDDRETGYFVPSWHADGVLNQSVSVAPISENMVSIVFNVTYDDKSRPSGFTHTFAHICLTAEETDILIKALEEAKTREKRIE